MGYHKKQQLVKELEHITEPAICTICDTRYTDEGDCMCDWHDSYELEAELDLFNADWL